MNPSATLAPREGGARRGRARPADAKSIRVSLADDRAFVARCLRIVLEREGVVLIDSETGGEVVAGDGRTEPPDVVVLDLELTGETALGAIRQLRGRIPVSQIVVVTDERDPAFARRALAAGAAGVVLRHRAAAELAEAVRRAAAGETLVSQPIAAALATIDNDDASGSGALTVREVEVLRLIGLGHTSAEIASELNVSRRTIDSHRANIHRKLGLTSRAELVQFALSRRLIGS